MSTPPCWPRALRTRKYRAAVGADHQESDEHDIFGVPTILFDGYQPTFIKLDSGAWEGPDDVELFHALYNIAAPRPYVMEIKKPASATVAAASEARRRTDEGR